MVVVTSALLVLLEGELVVRLLDEETGSDRRRRPWRLGAKQLGAQSLGRVLVPMLSSAIDDTKVVLPLLLSSATSVIASSSKMGA